VVPLVHRLGSTCRVQSHRVVADTGGRATGAAVPIQEALLLPTTRAGLLRSVLSLRSVSADEDEREREALVIIHPGLFCDAIG